MYDLVAPTLLDISGMDSERPSRAQPQATATAAAAAAAGGGGIDTGGKDPIMQARAVACLAAAWPRVPSPLSSAAAERNGGAIAAAAAAVCELQRAHAAPLTRALTGTLSRVVWSVRVPIYSTLSAVVSRTTAAESQTPVLTGSLLADVVQAVERGAQDPKYSQVGGWLGGCTVFGGGLLGRRIVFHFGSKWLKERRCRMIFENSMD